MILRSSTANPDLIEQVLSLISERLPAGQAEQVSEFARHFYRDVDPEDLAGRDPVDLYGAAVSHWRFARRRTPEATLLRIYNPKLDEHGWQCPHTVIEIVHRDMPFLVDSVRMQINAQGFISHLVIHPLVACLRDGNGELTAILPRGATAPDAVVESYMHLEISRETDPAALQRLEEATARTLADVRAAVDDWRPMIARMVDTVEEARREPPASLSAEEVSEGAGLLEWLMRDRYTFLGCCDYDLVEQDGRAVLQAVPGTGLGILRDDHRDVNRGSVAVRSTAEEYAKRPGFLTLTKSSSRSTVHKPTYADYVGIKRFDATGTVIGERRFLGLYTSAAYSTSVLEIPVVRKKARAVIERSGVSRGSHRGKALNAILETYPRDEMFQIGEDDLLRTATGILYLDERQRTRLFTRRDPFGRFISALVYIPRDNHTTQVRENIEALLRRELGGLSSESSVSLSESVLARALIVVHVKPGEIPDYDERDLEARIVQLVRRWEDNLSDALVARFGEERGTDLYRRYAGGFPAGYREDCSARMAVHDIELIEQLDHEDALALNLYAPLEAGDDELRFRLIRRGRAVPLSDIVPILERMGARVVDARPYEIAPESGDTIWLYDTGLSTGGIRVPLEEVRAKFHDAFLNVCRGGAESDDFNKLVLRAGLDWREIAVLRAFAKYARQTGFTFSQAYMESTLASHPQIARRLVDLFVARHDPHSAEPLETRGTALVAEIEPALDQVPSLDEDRILRRFLAMMLAVTRTNYFQRGPDGTPKPYLALKFDPRRIPGLPEPRPMFEIYVYSTRVEGVHLRGGRIARGGLRWSDRMEDFRTEVLGLMKAQMVKNAVIVPVGAKGGFVVKNPPPASNRDALLKEVVECYTTFLRGLLDLTGSRTGETVVPPPDVVRHDQDDTYLVVAADKGTATFSDIANGVAADYGFWMGDAFASGGSSGYDHKKMGITARGAWESVKKHFRTLGIDIQTTPFTVVGVGDLSGDVFGNGMLQSRQTQLVAAFDHRHIFLDPNPDPEASFRERERMFALPRSSWADYGASKISAGGGVFPRTAKKIPISPEVRARLGITAHALTPAELMQAILRAPVDLLYNGGIGTYVKATDETHADVGDRSNDHVRVDASELRCRVVGEGGNLGLTQAARIEFALRGGRVYTDAIDNSAGVDCSDHEVNIKILLNAVMADGRLTLKQRNQLLEDMTDEVGALVLQDNYRQAQALAIGSARNIAVFDLQVRFIRYLEGRGTLNRVVEGLPPDEVLAERKAAGVGLAAPERAVLLAYSKIWLYDQLVDSTLPEDPFVAPALVQYFPTALRERYQDAMSRHPLRREIIATYVCNGLVNRMGSSFVHRLLDETGATPAAVSRAYLVARAVFDLDTLWARIDALDNVVGDALQTGMHVQVIRLIERVTRWFLRHRLAADEIDAGITRFRTAVGAVLAALDAVLGTDDRERLARATEELVAGGVPADLARYVAGADHLYAALDISDVSVTTGRTLACVTSVYFLVAERLSAAWLRERISMLPSDTHWQTLARAALRNELAERLRQLTRAVLTLTPDSEDVPELIHAWEREREIGLTRMRHVLGELQTASSPDLAMLSVGLRELRNLA